MHMCKKGQSINIRLMRGMSKRRPTHVWHTIEWT